MSSPSKYLEQFNRVKRWYDRFAEINEGKVHDRVSDSYQDEVYAFFVNCYHLKDWIKNDGNIGDAAEKVEKFISSNEELILCRDICHSIKHLKLTTPRSGRNPEFGPRRFHMKLGGQQQTLGVRYSISTIDGPLDAFELATKCLEAWETFIKANISDEYNA